MPSIFRPTSSQKSHAPSSQKFTTVLGFNPYNKDSSDTDSSNHPFNGQGTNSIFVRKSIDTARSYTARRKPRADRLSVTDATFFESKPTPVPSTPLNAERLDTVDLTVIDMQDLDVNLPHPSTRRPPVRDNQDKPWSVSVAETPHDARSYSLYIKTPTHNLTLTRTAMEVYELDRKIRESYPDLKIPPVPINIDFLPTPPKRKSTFLNTLSRLASPTSGKNQRQASSSRRANNASSMPGQPTPLTSPSGEINGPFSSFTASNVTSSVVAPSSTISTGIAAYLTTVSNIPSLRQSRIWKRFVRVRTDDLESVRVERAIKRVRSDLAAHVGALKEPTHRASIVDGASIAPSETASIHEENFADYTKMSVDTSSVHTVAKNEETKERNEAVSDPSAISATVVAEEAFHPENGISDTTTHQTSPVENGVMSPSVQGNDIDDVPSTPVGTDSHLLRMHRSQSADPDKSSRLTRAYTASAPSQDGASSATGDESSISTTNGSRRASNRKKRSMSTAPKEPRKSQRKVAIDDFEMMRVLGKGCAGKVLLVRHKSTSDLFALKAITKRHVLAHQELQHTLTEQAVLKRMAAESRDPFVVKLWWSFHDKENLFLVMDFHPGGDLATQLARWGRLGRDRARFYAAEIVEGVEGLHAAGVIYRDLKPENILIGADGHIVLTDFGLSKEFPRRSASSSAPITPSVSAAGEFYSSAPGSPQPVTPPWMINERGESALGWPGQPIGHNDSTTTFCGTAEYLAPEVIQGLSYSYEVDWWSFGTMLYEMLTGITPFWANNHSDMYVRVLQDELQFPDDRAIDQDTKSLIRGLLQRNPGLRICEPRIKRHPYFSMIDWSHVYYKRYIPPYIPPIDPSNASDTQNFDDTFLDMEPVLDDFDAEQTTDTDQEPMTDADRTDGEETNTTPSQSRSSSIHPQQHQQPEDDTVDVFDGYSFKGRHSVIIDDDDDEGSTEESLEGDEEDNSSILKGVIEPQAPSAPSTPNGVPATIDEEIGEPKTPEARPTIPAEPVPENIDEIAQEQPPAEVAEEEPISEVPAPAEVVVPSKELPEPGPIDSVPPVVPVKEIIEIAIPPSKASARPTGNRAARGRREKSGVPALDKYLSDAVDEDTEATEADRDEDDDWDFIDVVDGEDRNGAKGTSLFARGVVDRYRLAVFRKASTPSQRSGGRSFSGMSKSSEVTVPETGDSPSPSQRRGRNPGGLNFRKHPRQFLRPKSPPSSYSSKTSMTAALSMSNSNTLSAASSSNGLLTPSLSAGSTLPLSPSLKSKESAISVGTQSVSSDQSGNGISPSGLAQEPAPVERSAVTEEPEKHRNKKLKKYKENAEKVFSLFSSPRQAT